MFDTPIAWQVAACCAQARQCAQTHLILLFLHGWLCVCASRPGMIMPSWPAHWYHGYGADWQDFEGLALLDIRNCSISGPLPESWGKSLLNLQTLVLVNTLISGALPPGAIA